MARADIHTSTYNPDERYSDFLMNFDKNPITGNLAKVTNEESVKQAIKNLVLTNQGERLYNQTLGSKVRGSLFDPVDASTAEIIRTTIEQTIKYHEPRANLLGVEIFDDSDNNAYKINIYFNLINIPEIIQLDLILKRAR